MFPSLGDLAGSSSQRRESTSEFAINFPHDKHLDVVAMKSPSLSPPGRAGFVAVSWPQTAGPKEAVKANSCPVCHQTYQPQGSSAEEFVTKPPKNLGDAFWLKKGTFKTKPSSHTVCFSCHNADLGIEPAPANCNACHTLATPQASLKTDFDPKLVETIEITDDTVAATWRRRISSGAFRHEGGEHPNLNCVNCHNAATMNTVDSKTRLVPIRSCGGAAGCHITATTDDGGILNYEIDQKRKAPGVVCTKCHISFGREAVPLDHLTVIPTAPK